MPLPQYYDDNADGWRYEKRTRFSPAPTAPQVPYYHQTTDFTCGPACLLMAMAALVPGRQMAPSDELRIWREATTIFMTRSEEHTSELQSLMRTSYAVFCLKKKIHTNVRPTRRMT